MRIKRYFSSSPRFSVSFSSLSFSSLAFFLYFLFIFNASANYHKSYKDNNYRDRVQLEQDPEGNNLFTITLYFYKKDYTLENIHTHLNNIVPNYAGTKVTEEQLKELQEIYEKGKIEQASKTYAVGPYTMELLLKKHNEDFYQVRFRYVSTSLYN